MASVPSEPRAAAAPRPARRHADPRWLGLTVALLGALGAVAAGLYVAARNHVAQQREFSELASRTRADLLSRFRLYEYGLRGARGAIIGAGEALSRDRFRRYGLSRDLEREFPGALGFGFIRRVPRGQEGAFVAAARSDGPVDFAIRSLAPHEGDRFVIQYIEPERANAAAVGLDIASEGRRRAAAVRAVATGEATLTAPIELVQAPLPDRTGFLMFLPVYTGETQQPEPGVREGAAIGWAYTPLIARAVLSGFDHHAEFAMEVTDVTAPAAPIPIVGSLFDTGDTLKDLTADESVPVYGRTLRVVIAARPAFVAGLRFRSPWLVGGAVLALALLASVALYAYLTSLRRRLQVSIERDQLASIVEFSDDAILTEDLDGKISSWNGGATRLLGYQPAEILGQPMAALYVGGQRDDDQHPLARARAGERGVYVDTELLAKNGEQVSVALTASLIRDASDRPVAVSVSIRDSREIKRTQIALLAGERRLRALAESIPHLVWTCNGDGACDYLSPQWVAYTGIPEADQLGYGWLAQLHPDDVAETQARWAAAATSSGVFDVQFRIRRHDGVYRWFQTRAIATRDEAGAITKWYGSNTDIQDLRDAQAATAAINQELEARVRTRTEELGAANQRLASVAAQLQTAQRITHVGSWELDLATGHVTWSEELYRIVGLEPSGPAPDYLAQERLFSPASWVILTGAIEQSTRTGDGYELTLDVVRADGQRRTAVARAESVRDAGVVVRLVGTFQDVTEVARVRTELTKLSERLQLATSAAKVGIWDWNLDDNVLIWDQTMHDLYRTRPEAFAGAYDAWKSRVHPDDLVATEQALAEAVGGSGDFTPAFRIVWPNGEVRHLRAAAAAHRGADGRTVRLIGVNWDITDQRVAELALRSSEAVQRGILAHAGSAIIATDRDGTITLFNRAAEELLGYTAAEVVGTCTPALIHDAAEVAARKEVLERELAVQITAAFEVFVIRTRDGRADANEWTYVRKDGGRVPVLLTVTALRDDHGEIIGYLGVAVDLTARKQQERDLVELNRLLVARSAQAESASEAKSMFLASMSHEIRTPMNAITGVAYLLERTTLSQEQRGLLHTVQSATKTLLGMINDILDLSKIEAGQLSLEVAPFPLSRVLDDLGSMMAGLASAKKLELIIDGEPGLPDNVSGDPVRLTQILANLLSNAIKFTEAGMVRLGVRVDGGDDERVWLRFEVQDSGPGIDDDLLPRLFAPFTQGARPGSQRVGGTGLGLAIVKQLVTMMGGEVDVTTRPGVGTDFWCRIPFDRATADDTTAAWGNLSVLVVDDNGGQRQALASCARRLGWRVETAASSLDALSRIEASARTARPFDAVVLDWRMPDDDGLQTLARIRSSLGAAAQPAVVMTTACDQAELRVAPGADLADVVLTKPVTSSALLDGVSAAMRARTGRDAPVRLLAPGPGAGTRLVDAYLLVVDDSNVNQLVARRILETEGARVETASNGLDAVERVRSASPPFDAILMDVQMPLLDGVEATRRIRALPGGAVLPIIAVTAGALASERQQALAAGMSDFISKPFEPSAVISAVRRHIESARGGSLPEVPARRAEPVEGWPVLDGIDTHDAATRLGGDVALFNTLLDQLLAEFTPASADARLGAAARGAPATADYLHKLRGIAGNLGARDLHRAAAAAEAAVRSPADIDLAPRLSSVHDELARLHASSALVPRSPRASDCSGAGLDAPALAALRVHLRVQHFDALALFGDLSPALRHVLGEERYAQLRFAVDRLDFPEALAVLDGIDTSLHR